MKPFLPLKKNKFWLRIFFLGVFTWPHIANACDPITSYSYPAFFLAYAIWFLLAFGFSFGWNFAKDEFAKWWYYPVSFLPFFVPMTIMLTFPLMFVFYGWPFYNAFQFVHLFFIKVEPSERIPRMLLFGLPTVIAIIGGIALKMMAYFKIGGFRTFLFYLNPLSAIFFVVPFAIGAIWATVRFFNIWQNKKEPT